MILNRRRLLAAVSALVAAPLALQAQEAPSLGLAPDRLSDLSDPHMPRVVSLTGVLTPGEIHVDPGSFHLYFTLPGGQAIRYSCGIGRPGLYEAGAFFIGAKKEWPSWTPTPSMIEREPEHYAQYADGMPGGPDNPLGARALYLFTEERGDTFLRIHGTNAPDTIGTEVSNGCARLTNEWITDLYDRVPDGAPVFLYPKEAA